MWQYNYTDELCHYGVQGMKWGVHRAMKKAVNSEYKSVKSKAKQTFKSDRMKAKNVVEYEKAKAKYEDNINKAKINRDMEMSKLTGKPYIPPGQRTANRIATAGKLAGVGALTVAASPLIALGATYCWEFWTSL